MFENVPPNLPTAKEPEDIFSGGSKSSVPPPPRPPMTSAPQTPPTAPPRPAAPLQSAPGLPPRPAAPTQLVPFSRPSSSPPVMPRPAVPLTAAAPMPHPAAPVAPPPVVMEKPGRSWLRVVLVLAVLGGLGVGAYFFITKGGLDLLLKQKAAPSPAPQIPVNVQLPSPPLVPEAVEPASTSVENVVPPPPIDSDGDGLTDEDETRLGTDPLKADSDGDGLLDNEEVRIYKSDPLNSDTDGDGYKDGDEVKNGYNPIGPGRLFQVPAQ